MTYATLRDEGYTPLEGDSGIAAPCPDECEAQATCGICQENTCPVHGLPVTGEFDAEDSHIADCATAGTVHRACHTHNCRSRLCSGDAA